MWVAKDFPGSDSRNYKENKAKHLVPERVNGLYRSGKNVFYELARVLRQMLMGHDFILSRVNLFRHVSNCTIK